METYRFYRKGDVHSAAPLATNARLFEIALVLVRLDHVASVMHKPESQEHVIR